MKTKTYPILITILLTAILAACQAAEWKEYNNQAGNFSVLMPGTPEETTQNVDTAAGAITTFLFQVNSTANSYTVAYSDYPSALISQTNAEAILDGAREGAVGNIQGKLLDEQQVNVSGFPGRQLKIESSDGKLVLDARIYLVESRLYQVLVASENGKSKMEEIQKFLDSFKLSQVK